MIIEKETLSQNKHDEIVKLYSVMFSENTDHYGVIKGIATACCINAVQINEDANEEGTIEDSNFGHVVAISPMSLATNIELLMEVAYKAGLKAGQSSK